MNFLKPCLDSRTRWQQHEIRHEDELAPAFADIRASGVVAGAGGDGA
ncbi:hypothetical protein [Sorangium sp. So ce1335]